MDSIKIKTKRRKCPNGQRWNNKTQKCEPYILEPHSINPPDVLSPVIGNHKKDVVVSPNFFKKYQDKVPIDISLKVQEDVSSTDIKIKRRKNQQKN